MLELLTDDQEAEGTQEVPQVTSTVTATPEVDHNRMEAKLRSEVWQAEAVIVRQANCLDLDVACQFLLDLQRRVWELATEWHEKLEHSKRQVKERELAMSQAKPGDQVELLENGYFVTSLPECSEEFKFQRGEVFQLVKAEPDHNGCCVVIDKNEITARIPRTMLRIYQPPNVLPASGTIRVGGHVRTTTDMALVTSRMVKRTYTPQDRLLVCVMTKRSLTVVDESGCFVRLATRLVVPIEPELPQANKPNTTEETSS